jgi:hypothetical protein
LQPIAAPSKTPPGGVFAFWRRKMRRRGKAKRRKNIFAAKGKDVDKNVDYFFKSNQFTPNFRLAKGA